MDPQAGRFTARDPFGGMPVDPKTLHRFSYAGQSPLLSADPSGEISELQSEVHTVGALQVLAVAWANTLGWDRLEDNQLTVGALKFFSHYVVGRGEDANLADWGYMSLVRGSYTVWKRRTSWRDFVAQSLSSIACDKCQSGASGSQSILWSSSHRGADGVRDPGTNDPNSSLQFYDDPVLWPLATSAFIKKTSLAMDISCVSRTIIYSGDTSYQVEDSIGHPKDWDDIQGDTGGEYWYGTPYRVYGAWLEIEGGQSNF